MENQLILSDREQLTVGELSAWRRAHKPVLNPICSSAEDSGFLWLRKQMESSLENVGPKHVPRSYQDITIQTQQSARVRKTKAHLFADVLHHELELSGVFTLTVEQVSPQSRRQHTVIGQDSLQVPTHVFTCMKFLLT